MTVQDHIAAYADGWTRGDVDKICAAAAPDMVLDDPNAGKIGKAGLGDYAKGLISTVAELRGGEVKGRIDVDVGRGDRRQCQPGHGLGRGSRCRVHRCQVPRS